MVEDVSGSPLKSVWVNTYLVSFAAVARSGTAEFNSNLGIVPATGERSSVNPEEFRESLKQFQVALQDDDHLLFHGLGRGQRARDQVADAGAGGEPELRLAAGKRAS